MAQVYVLLLLSGAALSIFTCVQGGTKYEAKRSADNPLSSFGSSQDFQSQMSGFTSKFPVKGADSFGIGNFPGLSQATGAAATPDKAKRSADNPLSSLGNSQDFQSQMSGFTSKFPVKGADSFGIGNFPGLSQATGAAATPDKAKRSADNPLSSLGNSQDFQSQMSGFTSKFPVKGADSFGIGNFPGLSQATGAAATPDKAKRSADNPLSSLGNSQDFQSQMSGFTSKFPVKGADSFGIGNFPGLSQATGAAATPDKAKRSADNPLSSLGNSQDFQSQMSGFTSKFPVKGADSFGIGNFPGLSQATGAAATPDKAKRSADNPLSSLGNSQDFQSQMSGFTSKFPVKGADSFGIGNFPGLSQATGAAATPDKAKRSADNPLSSLGNSQDFQSQMSGFTSKFPVKGADSFGIGNFPGLSQATGAAATPDKAKRSADNPLSSLGNSQDFQSQMSGFTSKFPVKGADSFGIGNFPGLSQATGAAATPDKAKRSADNPLSSLGNSQDFQSQMSGFTSKFPVKGADSFGIGNFPGLSQATGAAATPDKAKRSADNPLSSLGNSQDFQSQMSGFTSKFPVKGADSFGIGNFPGLSQATGAAATPDKAKRSADNPLSSLGNSQDFQSQMSGFTSKFPVKGADSFGIGNFPGLSQATGAAATPDKAKRSADNPLSSLGNSQDFQSQMSGFTSKFPVKGADSFGIGNFPGLSQATGAAATPDKAKRSADNPLSSLGNSQDFQSQMSGFTSKFPVKGADSLGIGNFPGLSQGTGAAATPDKAKRSADNPLSSLGNSQDFQSQMSGFTSKFPVKGADSFGIGNFPGLSQATGGAGTVEKTKRSSHESSPSWTQKLKSLFTGRETEN